MAIFCHIAGGLVEDRAIFQNSILPPNWPDAGNWVQSDVAQIGWAYANGVFTPPAPAAPAAPSLDQQRIIAILSNPRRQAILTAALSTDDAGIITYINNNVTDLPSARTMIENLALVILAVIRS